MGCTVRAYKLATTARVGPVVDAQTPSRYHGFSIRNTTGTNAVTLIITQTGAYSATEPVEEIVVPANGNVRQWYGDDGITVTGGLYVKKTGSGTPVGAVYAS